MKNPKISTIRNNLVSIADEVKNVFDTTKDLRAGLIAIKAYSEATKTSVAQIRYKQLTGSPTKIDFLEE